MEGLSEAVAACAASVRRDAVALLITAHMPVVPVAVKPPAPRELDRAAAERVREAMDKRSLTEPQPRIFRTKARRRGVSRAYEVTGLPDTSRAGTFRRYMLSEIILKHSSTGRALAAHYATGRYSVHKIDFNWAAKEGYIRFI